MVKKMSEFIYITDEYPNPPKRISILMEPSSKKSIKEYFKNVLKRKEQKVMKFKVGDKVRIKKPGGYHNNMVAVITKINYESITGNRGYQIHINGFPSPNSFVWIDDELELIENATFTKADLKDGMVVEIRNGEKYFLCAGTLMSENLYTIVKRFRNDLTHESYRDIDIMKVYKTSGCLFSNVFANSNLTLIWERKEEPYKEMTVEEIEKQLGHKVKIVG